MQRRTFLKSATALSTGLLLSSQNLLAQIAPPDLEVKHVLIMFKCHFDAGFIDTQTNVVHKYFNQYFPQAIHIAAAQNASGQRRYTWTTGSWLLYEYLEQASPADRKSMEQAIAANQIAWHALPFSWQTEMLDQSLIEGALAISQSLDKRFGRTTTGAKMTDVPGHTRGLIKPLAKHGIDFLDIGVNGGSTPAQLPPIFLWKDPSGATLPVMYHHEYGAITRVPNSDLVIDIEVRGDNSGPHTPDEIAAIYDHLKSNYPNAKITAANLTEIANAVEAHRGSLPVITQEIGDTWIYGVASDPLKVARYREVARLRDSWIASGHFQIGDATDLALLRHLLLEAEHTWGTDTKTWLDFDNYKPADLEKMIDTRNYKVVQFSWQEKRQDLLDAIATLPTPLRDQAAKAIEGLAPTPPARLPRYPSLVANGSLVMRHFTVSVDSQTGAITQLRNNATGREWAGKTNPIAIFTYQTLSKEDYDRFIASYLTTKADWAFKDFGKPNIERFGARSQDWQPKLTDLYFDRPSGAERLLLTLQIDDQEAFESGRAAFPRQISLELLFPTDEPIIHLTLSCFQKPPTRLPEALWLTFNPIAISQNGWTLDKSGESISPFEVVTSGNRHMHAVSRAITYKEGRDTFILEPIDNPVVAFGERTPLLFNNNQPDLSQGIHSNLYNNAWGTNYIMWYGEDMRSRYLLRP